MKRYSEEFKEEAVKLALDGSVSRAQVARELGVNVNSLAGWILQYEDEHGGSVGRKNETPEQENRRLRKENERLRMERDILKKAVGIFSKELR